MSLIVRLLALASFLASTTLAGENEISAEPTPSPTPDKSQYNLFNPTPIELRRAYNTDRSSKTDSPFTVDAGTFQIESDVANWTVDIKDHVRTRIWIISNTNFKIGLTNWMDFQIFPQFYVNTRTSGSSFGSPIEEDGFGDTTVRLKINFVGNDGGKLAIGFLASLKIPTNSDHLANHVWEPGFEVPVSYSLPWGITFFGQTRVDVLDEPHGKDARVQWQNPIGLSRTIAGNLSGYVEFYDAISSGRDHPWVGTFDTGLVYQVTPNFSVDINAFFGLTDSAPDDNIFIGFARRF